MSQIAQPAIWEQPNCLGAVGAWEDSSLTWSSKEAEDGLHSIPLLRNDSSWISPEQLRWGIIVFLTNSSG